MRRHDVPALVASSQLQDAYMACTVVWKKVMLRVENVMAGLPNIVPAYLTLPFFLE